MQAIAADWQIEGFVSTLIQQKSGDLIRLDASRLLLPHTIRALSSGRYPCCILQSTCNAAGSSPRQYLESQRRSHREQEKVKRWRSSGKVSSRMTAR